MTGKQQKAVNAMKDFKERVELTLEEKTALTDEAVIQVHTENEKFLEETAKLPIKAFRGMYIVYTLFRQVDELANNLAQKKLAEKAAQYVAEEEAKKRRKF